jgi:hypothetical protein
LNSSTSEIGIEELIWVIGALVWIALNLKHQPPQCFGAVAIYYSSEGANKSVAVPL